MSIYINCEQKSVELYLPVAYSNVGGKVETIVENSDTRSPRRGDPRGPSDDEVDARRDKSEGTVGGNFIGSVWSVLSAAPSPSSQPLRTTSSESTGPRRGRTIIVRRSRGDPSVYCLTIKNSDIRSTYWGRLGWLARPSQSCLGAF